MIFNRKSYLNLMVCLSVGFLASTPQALAQCYPGLGDCSGPDSGGQRYYYVGPVRPPDPWLALRSEPSSSSGHRIMKMPEGTLFRLLGASGKWYKVQLRDGTTGWAHGDWIRCCKVLN
jgi:Bacterial SH3 domain